MAIPATSRGPAGMHPGLAEGHVYLVEGTDGKFALVRLPERRLEIRLLRARRHVDPMS
jgi:hypothetical protein